MAEYRFRENIGITVGDLTPQIIGETLADIEDRHGIIDPHTVVEESKPDDAPLHPVFEWRDDVAAEKWRTDQARRIVRSVEVVIPARHNSTQIAYVNIPSKKGYVSGQQILQSAELYREAEALFLDRLISARQQLERIKALSPFERRPHMELAAEHLEKAKELVSARRPV
jgi:tRNA A37 N6-isopentenylltransferase MiaA